MRWPPIASPDERCGLWTAKSCGPDIPTLISSLRDDELASDGDNKPGLRGEHEGNRNTIAQGMPALSGEPVVTNLRAFLPCTQGCGCALAPGIPCALLISEDVVFAEPGRDGPREGSGLFSNEDMPRKSTGQIQLSRYELIAMFSRPTDVNKAYERDFRFVAIDDASQLQLSRVVTSLSCL
jgi:hypothetical protein